MLEIEKTKKTESSIHLPDGRISPDKAIKLVCKLMDEMSDEEFVRLATKPVVLKGPGGHPLEEPIQDRFLFQKPLAHYRHTIAPIISKKPHNHGPPRPMIHSFDMCESQATSRKPEFAQN